MDLAVGVPSEDMDDAVQAGVVQVLFGSVDGVTSTGAQPWHQNSDGIDGAAEDNDFFGTALAAIPAGARIFTNGFESGDTSRWSGTAP